MAASDLLHPQRHLGGGEAGVSPAVHRRRSGMRRLTAEAEAVALDPGAAADRGGRAGPRPRAPAPARCGARGRRQPLLGGSPPRGARSRSTPFSASTSASTTPSASRRSRTAAGSRVPENAELPNRLRPKRAPSSSAQSTSASVRGGRAPGRGPCPEHAERRHHAERAVEPATLGHRVEVRAERQRGLGSPSQRGPEVSGRVGLGRRGRSRRAARRAASAPGATRRPSRHAGPRRPRRCGDRARAGRRSPGRRRSPARRSSVPDALAAKRLRKAVGAAAPQGEHRQVEL